MSKTDRINQAYNYLLDCGLAHKKKDIADKMGATAPNVSSALNGKASVLTDKFLLRFNSAFGNIFNDAWLLTGEGEMLNSDQPRTESLEVKTETATTVPLIPISAQGGSLNEFVVSIKGSECERIISPINGADFAIQVSGDSMAPEYPNGSRVFIKKINERAFIEWGKTYVLDTCNGTVIKTLVPSEKPECVKCISINPDPIYAPFEVNLQDVYGLYKVLLCMSVK